MRRYIYILAMVAIATACVKEPRVELPQGDDQPTIIIPEDANAGEVIIKFNPAMEDIIEQTMTRSGGNATRSGIPSTDEVLEILGAYSFEYSPSTPATRSAHARPDSICGISYASMRVRT